MRAGLAFCSLETIAFIPRQIVKPKPPAFRAQYFHVIVRGHETRSESEMNLGNPVSPWPFLSSEYVGVD